MVTQYKCTLLCSTGIVQYVLCTFASSVCWKLLWFGFVQGYFTLNLVKEWGSGVVLWYNFFVNSCYWGLKKRHSSPGPRARERATIIILLLRFVIKLQDYEFKLYYKFLVTCSHFLMWLSLVTLFHLLKNTILRRDNCQEYRAASVGRT